MNRYLLTIICTLSLGWMTTALYSMECALAEIAKQEEKPTIKAKLLIGDNNTAFYNLTDYYHKEFQKYAGIRSDFTVPMISVSVLCHDSTGVEQQWKDNNIPGEIAMFEFHQNHGYDINQFHFFNQFPITYLLNARTGTILRGNFCGYPIELTCTDKVSISFENAVKERILCLADRPGQYCGNLSLMYGGKECMQQLVAKQLIRISNFVIYTHGEKSLASAFYILLQQNHNSEYFKQALLRIFYSLADQEKYSNATLLLSFVRSLEQ